MAHKYYICFRMIFCLHFRGFHIHIHNYCIVFKVYLLFFLHVEQKIFSQIPIDGHLHCFLCVCNCKLGCSEYPIALSLQACANISVAQTPKMELHFKFDRHCQIVLQNCSNSHSHQMCESTHFSTLFASLEIISLNFLQT